MRVREASTAAVLNSRRGPAAVVVVVVVYNARARVCACVCVRVCKARARVQPWPRPVRGGARGAVVSQLIGTATAAIQSGESGVCEGRIDRRTWTAVSVCLARSPTRAPLPTPLHPATHSARPWTARAVVTYTPAVVCA